MRRLYVWTTSSQAAPSPARHRLTSSAPSLVAKLLAAPTGYDLPIALVVPKTELPGQARQERFTFGSDLKFPWPIAISAKTRIFKSTFPLSVAIDDKFRPILCTDT